VIRVGDRYYLVRDGIWFVGDTTEGPFEVARAVPDEIYTIPPSSPVYNVTYVRIYNTEPDAVWFGYTAGYLHAYLSWGTIVYGSGWHHRPHWHNWRKHGRYPVYFRRHLTFGSGIYYNPLRRAFGRYGFYYGPHRGLGFGKRYHWRKHRHVRLRPAYRRDDGRNFLSAYNPSRNLAVSRTRPKAANLAGNDVYGGWKSKGVKRSKNWARERRMNGNANLKWRKANNRSNNQAVNRSEIFAGQDGKVYRRKNGTWQRREGSKWSRANESSGDAAKQFRKRDDAPKKTLRKKANTKRKTITRKKKPHLRRSLDASRASNKKAIQKRQRSLRKVDKSNKKRLKRQFREEKQP
jgi:hypothetical protein